MFLLSPLPAILKDNYLKIIKDIWMCIEQKERKMNPCKIYDVPRYREYLQNEAIEVEI